MSAPAFTVQRYETTATGGARILVRAAGGRRVQVYVSAEQVRGERIEEAIAVAFAHLSPSPVRRT